VEVRGPSSSYSSADRRIGLGDSRAEDIGMAVKGGVSTSRSSARWLLTGYCGVGLSTNSVRDGRHAVIGLTFLCAGFGIFDLSLLFAGLQ
jgi:hypothetical protein